jgi:hypothetical protein
MRNRFILFAIGAEVMGSEWGLTQSLWENRSISISYKREKVYLLKSCYRIRLILQIKRNVKDNIFMPKDQM